LRARTTWMLGPSLRLALRSGAVIEVEQSLS
jgi:hypothetical protein